MTSSDCLGIISVGFEGDLCTTLIYDITRDCQISAWLEKKAGSSGLRIFLRFSDDSNRSLFDQTRKHHSNHISGSLV